MYEAECRLKEFWNVFGSVAVNLTNSLHVFIQPCRLCLKIESINISTQLQERGLSSEEAKKTKKEPAEISQTEDRSKQSDNLLSVKLDKEPSKQNREDGTKILKSPVEDFPTSHESHAQDAKPSQNGQKQTETRIDRENLSEGGSLRGNQQSNGAKEAQDLSNDRPQISAHSPIREEAAQESPISVSEAKEASRMAPLEHRERKGSDEQIQGKSKPSVKLKEKGLEDHPFRGDKIIQPGKASVKNLEQEGEASSENSIDLIFLNRT